MAEFNQHICVSKDKLANNQIDLISLMMACGISPGGATTRRLIRGGAAFVNGTKVVDENYIVKKEMLLEGVEIRIGKKICVKAVFAE
jgi:tyrosyl-tRNA synthetase